MSAGMTRVVHSRGVTGPLERFGPLTIERRHLRPHDVSIDIAYSGICHSDIHHVHNDYGKSLYPLVPGHEIAGTVAAVGQGVTAFAVGDRVGVGCMIDSCRECEACRAGMEQFCLQGDVKTANAIDRDGQPTLGGYSESIVVDHDFVVRIPDAIPLDRAAPLLCAGVTIYSPLRHWGAGPAKRVGIVGFGGLGHIGVQMAHALGAHTTVLDISLDKKADGLRLGADEYFSTTEEGVFKDLARSFDLIICTVPVNIDYDTYLGLLGRDGALVLVGVPSKPVSFAPFSLIFNRRSIAGTLIGGIPETQEMLDFCGEHEIGAEVEVVDADYIDEAYKRVAAGDVRFRFVIDGSTFASN